MPQEQSATTEEAGSADGVEQQLQGLSLGFDRQDAGRQATQACASSGVVHPFETEPGDHAETPLSAYEHIEQLLARVAT